MINKFTIIESLIVLPLNYRVANIPCLITNQFFKQLKIALYKYIWESTWKKITRRKTLGTDIQGVKIIGIRTYFRALRFV